MTPEEFRAAAHELVDWVADYRLGVADRPVQSVLRPGQVRSRLPAHAPAEPQPLAELITMLNEAVVPGITQTQSPAFFGWFPSNADARLGAGRHRPAAAWPHWASPGSRPRRSPRSSRWSPSGCGSCVDWPRCLARRHPGHRLDGTLVAMLAARERASGMSIDGGGLQSCRRPWSPTPPRTPLVGAEGRAAGRFRRDNLRFVEVDPVTYAMRPEALARGHGRGCRRGPPRGSWRRSAPPGRPRWTRCPRSCAIARPSSAHGCMSTRRWPARRCSCRNAPPLRRGRLADSLVWNPHKWIGTILDCSLLYVRDVDHLVACMSTTPPYLRSAVDDEVVQFKDWGIPLGRRFRALKLWFHLHLEGSRRSAAAAPGPRECPPGSPIRLPPSRVGECSPRCPCRPCACDTSRTG
jgi:aromatic-L-amino-acid decarboxylase